jgi:hypothetical protein
VALYIADMADSLRIRVRPTLRFLRDLGLSFPRLEEPLWRIPHPLVAHMQKTPDEVRAGGAEPIRSLSDRLWWKCKTSDLRAVITRLTHAELAALDLPESAPWWGGAAGVRRDDSASDFYRQLGAEALRHGRGTGKPRTGHLLPQQVDADRLKAETAALAVEATRSMVLSLVAGSLLDGKAHTAIMSEHVITALVRAEEGGDAYLAIAAEGFIQPRIIALMLSTVPGISDSDWQAEPGGVTGIKPREGQIIWSTVIPLDVQAHILELQETTEQDRR